MTKNDHFNRLTGLKHFLMIGSVHDETLEIIHLPGHTPGSIGVLHQEKKLLCTGDMLFSDFTMLDSISGQGSQSDFEKSMEKIIKLISEEKVR